MEEIYQILNWVIAEGTKFGRYLSNTKLSDCFEESESQKPLKNFHNDESFESIIAIHLRSKLWDSLTLKF